VDWLLRDVLDLGARLLMRLLYGFRWERLLDRYVAASARLEIQASTELRALMQEMTKLLFDGRLTESRLAEWGGLRKELALSINAWAGDSNLMT
jgi:hypothetical protein